MHSFLPTPPDCHFPLQNLPYGIFSTAADRTPRPGVAIGDHVLDLRVVSKAGLLAGPHLARSDCFQQPTLNAFMALGKPAWQEARAALTRLLSAEEGALRDDAGLRALALTKLSEVSMHLPASIGDYTDFYASREHATNVGAMFRSKDDALQPNWLHLPVGYHGRASSVVVSGTPVRRPWGQVRPDPQQPPRFDVCRVLDFELEMGCFIGGGNELGSPVLVGAAPDHIFGYVLLNDWSARDVQKWEYVPLGPFASKNWATSISPWVVTPEALAPFAAAPPAQDPPPLPYLREPPGRASNYDVRLEVAIRPDGAPQAATVTRSSMRSLYWTPPQMIAHHTAGGCNLRPGDLLGTGTISSEGPGGQGCMLELSWNGSRAVALEGLGQERRYLEDGDTVVLTGYCQAADHRVGFGECAGTVLPALPR